MRLILVRHGSTDWAVSGRQTGRADLPLNEDGRRECAQAAVGLERVVAASPGPLTVFSSPLARATETAAIMLGGGVEVQQSSDLMEVDFGDHEGRTKAEIRAVDPTWSVWSRCPGGETFDDVVVRADRWLASVEGPGSVLAFGHGILLRTVAARALGLDGTAGAVLSMHTAGTSIIDIIDGERLLRSWNFGPWLGGWPEPGG